MQTHSVILMDTNQCFSRIATQMVQESCSSHAEVIELSSTNSDTLGQIQHLKPDIIVFGLDHYYPKHLELVKQFRSMLPKTTIIVMGSLDFDSYREAAIISGADAFVTRGNLYAELLPVIREVMAQTDTQKGNC